MSAKCVLFSVLILLLVLMCIVQVKNNQDSTSGKSNRWFTKIQVAENVWRIDDHGGDNIYLVLGKNKALLIDTGNGISDLAGFVKTITNLPLLVLNTHGHPDHAGGNFQFPEVYAHPKDSTLTKYFTSTDYHDGAIQQTQKNNPDLESTFIRDISAFNKPTYLPVAEGFVFDLGDRKLEVIETPGHTPGSIVLLDAANKLLFTGDNNNTVVWLFLDGCLPLEAYLQTLQKLQARDEEFEKMLPGHGDALDKFFIDEQIICLKNIISGECKGEKYENFIRPALQCGYKRARVAFNPDNIFIKK
ncbi:MAG: MBL fold metallo-hydrolase [Calditrichaceae bacterium]|nr:MBL fold metallo-hydrolase [Calditrichaceae bacterium]